MVLERELDEPLIKEVLRVLQTEHEGFRGFDGWLAITQRLHQRMPIEQKDAILRPMLKRYSEQKSPALASVLLLIFWKSLTLIWARKRHWDPDDMERWQNLQFQFLKIIAKFNVKRRGERIYTRITNEVIHRAHDVYASRWRDSERAEGVCDSTTREEFESADTDSDGFSTVRDTYLLRLREHLELNHIDQLDFDVVLNTRFKGIDLMDYAKQTGVAYDALRKRRMRAEARIRDFEKQDE